MKIPRLEAVPGTMLPMEEYAADFLEIFHDVDGVIWKLERAQSFDEGTDPSWNAMREGDWRRSLELLDEARAAIAADLPAKGELRRVRVVETPLTAYLQWELHLLALRMRLGERGRVLDAREVAAIEMDGPLPELVVFPGRRMYHVQYEQGGACRGARRIDDDEAVRTWGSIVSSLYDRGEDLLAYVDKRVMPLAPPRIGVSAR
ncbi:DUF6879 family protein [Microbispora bryophytorum]|uniref:DUF6879 domain-containing protein n=1 Tax=Microbispora bryophytorum TaxID=1460882 RepID=A0A8H9H6P1_9ACTN|nr:DUF6879 family protein [Microbispora bryophytorum]MBD3140478.1 hypothetical protein [Microbispora bryophytorum]TQS01755.1 hypothetical protein FLX07_31135 [Microbispora bryophytorum]GGO30261.1 hypothetical protein GCM10011574_66460 [Microbispora bryophytorum]